MDQDIKSGQKGSQANVSLENNNTRQGMIWPFCFVLPSQTWPLRRLRDLVRDYSLSHQRSPSNKRISGL